MSPLTSQAAPLSLAGRTLGDFVVKELIGQGGFGAVYRAEQPLLAREAVIKVLHNKHRTDDTIIQRFLREARLASRLDHPYAAHTYAFGAEPDGLLWIAMELVRGTPLSDLLKTQGPIALERFVPLLERICEVVHTAHEQGIVHRDLKPANVMVLSRAGRLLPKLLDFGIAKFASDPGAAGNAKLAETDSGPVDDGPVVFCGASEMPTFLVEDDDLTQEKRTRGRLAVLHGARAMGRSQVGGRADRSVRARRPGLRMPDGPRPPSAAADKTQVMHAPTPAKPSALAR